MQEFDDVRQFNTAELANIFDHAARASNREWRSTQRDAARIPDFELPPAQQMMDRSPIVNYARQVLPENLGATKAGNWVADVLQGVSDSQPQMRPTINRINALAEKMPLGGYSKEEVDAYSAARAEDVNLRRATVEAGMVPTPSNATETSAKGNIGALAAQGAGVVAGDVASDGLRNIWWFVNAPQALANLVADETIQREGHKILERANEPIIKNRGTRMAATLPAVLATSFGVGNVAREEGYKAVLPSDADPRQSENAVAEAGARYFLGRTGGLLPYNEFVKERPDVSKEEYQKYKTYLFDKGLDLNPLDGDVNIGGVVKGTVDGIHGPEVSFMGKSIPALTGILPVATAIAGARRGMARAKDQLRNSPDGDLIARNDLNYAEYDRVSKQWKRQNRQDDYDPALDSSRPVETVSDEQYNQAVNDYQDSQRAVERNVLQNALLGGGLGAAAGGVGGTALESVIRSLKPQHTAEES